MNSVEVPLLGLLVLDWTSKGSCEKQFLTGCSHRVLRHLALLSPMRSGLSSMPNCRW